MTFRYKYLPANQEFNLLNIQQTDFEYYGPFELIPNYVKISEAAQIECTRQGVKYCGLVIPKRKRKN